MMGTPVKRANEIIPSLTRMRGPRGPSGVTPTHWPAFNLADTFISVGAVIFFLSLFIKESKTN